MIDRYLKCTNKFKTPALSLFRCLNRVFVTLYDLSNVLIYQLEKI